MTKTTPILERTIVCPKCRTKTMRLSYGYSVGREYFDDRCRNYFGVDELVNQWGYDGADFLGDDYNFPPANVWGTIVDVTHAKDKRECEKKCDSTITHQYGKALSWNELADIYNKNTGRHAKTMKMETVWDWAKNQSDKFIELEDGTLHEIEYKPVSTEDKLVATTWFDGEHVVVCDEPIFKSQKDKEVSYEVVTRMLLEIPEWSMENNEVDYGYPI